MSQSQETPKQEAKEAALDGGAYEIIRTRLLNQGKDLRSRLEQLNSARKEIFGAIEHTLLATERITTRHNCVPRDMAPINGNQFIFGYNVRMGLKTEIQLSDVFSVYEYKDHTFRQLSWEILSSGQFEEDLKNLYKYYKGSHFAKFSVIGPHLYMIFRVGKSQRDIKAFKWLKDNDGISYMDNRSDHEIKFPKQHEFDWVRTTRDQHRTGEHPHVSVEDRVFVEAVGGDITFKIEDNTETGQGIYAEAVDNPDQTLDDAEINYAVLGHIILVRIKPYMEQNHRYFIFNEKTQQVVRADEIENACVLLPDNHGLIFSNGYYLKTGELKLFERGVSDMIFENRMVAPNGEDFLYTFYNQESGDYIMLSYNLIEQQVETPIRCNGFSHFSNGEMIFFRSDPDPVKHHVIQIWQTPYVSGEHAFTEKSDAFLYKVGNPSIVHCMAECNEILRLMNREELYATLYIDIVKKARDIADAYFWIDKPDAFDIKAVIRNIRKTASGAIEEFEKVVRLKKSTADAVEQVQGRVQEIFSGLAPEQIDEIDGFVQGLAALRTVRGEIISLKDLRYADLDMIDALDQKVAERTDEMSGLCVEFLLKEDALVPYESRVKEAGGRIDSLSKMTEAKELEEAVTAASDELEMLIEIVSNLKIDDATQTTRIIDSISAIYSQLNQVKAALKTKKKSLMSVEGTAQFGAQIKLLNQSVINYLDICDTPEKCDEYLTKTMISLEELESRFTDFDEFIVQLSEKRDEIYNAFESKKLNLVEARNRRADALKNAADRILKGIHNRVSGMDDINAINGYFASDLMISKIRDIVAQLLDIDDTVKADEIQSRLKTVREDTVRQLKDRQELFEGGENIIRMGNHRFTVNVQPLDLTLVRRKDRQMFHLTGTNFFEALEDEAFDETRPVWKMEVVSEDKQVYRGEYLAFRMLQTAEKKGAEEIERLAALSAEEMLQHVQQFMGPRYAEGYVKGVHDHDGARIFSALIKIHGSIGLLRFHPAVRAFGRLFHHIFFKEWSDETAKTLLTDRLQGVGVMEDLFPERIDPTDYLADLEKDLTLFHEKTKLFPEALIPETARYLFRELSRPVPAGTPRFVISSPAWQIVDGFLKHIKAARFTEKFKEARERLASAPVAEFRLVRDWISSYVMTLIDPDDDSNENQDAADYTEEAAALVFQRNVTKREVIDISTSVEINGMQGDHPVIREKGYRLNYLQFLEKLTAYEQEITPLFQRYSEMKKTLTDKMRESLRLDEFRPRVLTSFVRNRLINQVYLPLIGDNLAKQIGAAGEGKRTDLMGLLLLVSPPGYGKTTLMEYIANRLGVIFMKINGPAIGYHVTSLDPAEAPNASAREEMQKLNLSLEMGDNVMIYLDDIQHCNPELLQKFISLCDAQRKIEGVYKGKSRTYDLRGKKVVVVMAGNPYTESGDKFKIPDMLANRADTYNLGDIIGDTADAFKMSYLENSLTSNPALNLLSSRSQKDVYGIIRIAETGSREGVEFEGSYSTEEINEMVSVMKKMIVVREVILKVNLEYIRSAAQADEYRTEPAFKLQGSYRNMNRLAEKIVPIMNEDELKELILSHYENESQTLTSDTEANLLKFKEMVGWMTEEETERWEEIKRKFQKNQLFKGMDQKDTMTQVVGQLSAFYDALDAIRAVLASAMGRQGKTAAEVSFTSDTLIQLETLIEAVKATLKTASEDEKKPEASPADPTMEAFTEVVQKQFEMMNTWLEPSFKQSQLHTRVIQKLSRDIRNLKAVYQEIIHAKDESDFQSIERYNSALKMNPKDHTTYYKRGMAWYNQNDLHRAVSDFKNALDIKPKNKKYQRIVAHLEAELTTDKVDGGTQE